MELQNAEAKSSNIMPEVFDEGSIKKTKLERLNSNQKLNTKVLSF
jgi:hypothetical protein